MTKKMVFMVAIAMGCNLYGMDEDPAIRELRRKICDKSVVVNPQAYVRYWEKYRPPVNSDVKSFYNVPLFHNLLHDAVIFDKRDDVQALLRAAEHDAAELVSTEWSAYGTILEATYIENKSEIRAILMPYFKGNVIQQCFERIKENLNWMWSTESYKKGLMRNVPSENLVRDLYLKDCRKFPLTPAECRLLKIEVEER